MKTAPLSPINSARVKRILVYSTSEISDTILSFPFVHRLRELEPEAHLAVLCPANLHDLWQRNPHLNEVIAFDPAPDIRDLRQREFDLALILPNSCRAAWECWRAHIPRRIGFAGHRRRWLLTDVVLGSRSEQAVPRQCTVAGVTFTTQHFPTPRHQAHRYLDLISHLGGNRDLTPPRLRLDVGQLPALKHLLGSGERTFIGILTGPADNPAKQWPADRLADAARRIAEEHPCRLLILGGPGEVALAADIERRLRDAGVTEQTLVNAAGKTTLMELCQLLSCCKLVLANDTGPLHLTAALNIPLVALFGSTAPELTGPLGSQSVVLRGQAECAPCFLRECPIDFRCMQSLTVEQVVAAALKLLPPLGT